MRLLRGARREGGQALVEFALVLPVLLVLILGLFDVARAVEQENTLAYAAREGARYAIVHGSTSSPSPIPYCSSCTNATVTTVVANAAISVPSVSVTIGYPDGNTDRGSRVSVEASAPFVPLASQFFLRGALDVTLRGGSELVIQH